MKATLTREQFIDELEKRNMITMEEWNMDLYRCPRCNGGVKRDYSVTFEGNPPKYRYFCRECTYSEIL